MADGVERTWDLAVGMVLRMQSEFTKNWVWKSGMCLRAARKGQLAVLQWLRAHGCPWNSNVLEAAAKNGHLELLQWAVEHGLTEWNWFEVATLAAGHGHLRVLEWCKDHYPDYDSDPFAGENWERSVYLIYGAAAQRGQLDVVKWMRGQGVAWDGSTLESAAAHGHLEILKWARSEGCPWGGHECLRAALSGHFEILKWLHEHGCPWTGRECATAAKRGDMRMLKWLHEKGSPWYGTLECSAAAERGDVEMLRWLHERGRHMTIEALQWVAGAGKVDVLVWAFTDGGIALLEEESVAWFQVRKKNEKRSLNGGCARVVHTMGQCELTPNEMQRMQELVKSQITLVLALRASGVGPELAQKIGRLAGMPWI